MSTSWLKRISLFTLCIAFAIVSVPVSVSAQNNSQSKNVWDTLNLSEKNDLVKFLSYFSDGDIVDMTRLSDGDIMKYIQYSDYYTNFMSNAAVLNKSSKELVYIGQQYEYAWDFYPYNFDVINHWSQTLFGRTLSKESNSYGYYIENTLYLPSLELGGTWFTNSYQPYSLKELKDDFYLVNFDIYYTEKEFENYAEQLKFANLAKQTKSTWSAKEVAIFGDKIGIGQAIVRKKVVDGKVEWNMYKLQYSYDSKDISLSDTKLNMYLDDWGSRTKPSSWAQAEVAESIKLGLVPSSLQDWYTDNINRAQFSQLLVQFMTKKTGKSIDTILQEQGVVKNSSTFSDTQDRNVLAVNALGIISGRTKGKFDPQGYVTCEEAAAMLSKTAMLLSSKPGKGTKVADNSKQYNWVKDTINVVASLSGASVKGTGSSGIESSSFKNYYTKEQAYITVKRLYNSL